VVIFVGGITARLEGEEMGRDNAFGGFEGGDRTTIELPSVQTDLLKALAGTGKPVILVNCSGSPMAMPWEAGHLPAILQAWYPGEQGGRAVAEILFGQVNPQRTLAAHVLCLDGGLAGLHRLFDEQPHVSLLQWQAAIRVRSRHELHEI
jgi:beta-glucosidase